MDWLKLKESGESIFIHGDCMDYLPTMPDKFSELAIVDPPYGLGNRIFNGGRKNIPGRISASQYNGKSWDLPPDDSYFIILRQKTKNQIVWGGNYFNLGPSRCFIIWDKLQPLETFSFGEFAWTSFDLPARKITHMYTNYVDGKLKPQRKIHPTQKPIELYRKLLLNYANPGDLILDTHVGSASSLIACEQMGFQYVGIEKDKDYYNAACERMEKAREKMKQGEMFERKEIEVKQETLF